MKLTPLLQKAINRSAELHREHTRKFSHVPYIVHPFSLAVLLSEYTDDDRVFAGALLHDVVEDVLDYELEDVQEEFGPDVAKIVRGVTEIKHSTNDKKEKLSWKERKNYYITNLKQAPEGSLMVAAADKIHNISSLLDAYEEYGDSIWKNFHGDMNDQIWFYEEVYKILKERLDNPIVDRYKEVLDTLKQKINRD